MIDPTVFTKYPSEIIVIEIDFSDTVPPGASISSASCVVLDRSGSDVTARIVSNQSYASGKLSVTLQDGEARLNYMLWATVDYSDGQRSVFPLTIRVLDGP